MKKCTLLSLAFIFMCNTSLAAQQLLYSSNDDNNSTKQRSWSTLFGQVSYGCLIAKQGTKLSITVTTLTHDQYGNPLDSIKLICSGINGYTQQHVDPGQTATTCTIACNTNQFISWNDDAALPAYGAAGTALFQFSTN